MQSGAITMPKKSAALIPAKITEYLQRKNSASRIVFSTKKSRFGREIKTVYPFCFSKNNANNIFASETKKIATVKNEKTIKCKNKVPH